MDEHVTNMLHTDLFEEAEQRIKEAFVDNEARTHVLTVVSDEVFNKLIDKISPKVCDELTADNPTLALA